MNKRWYSKVGAFLLAMIMVISLSACEKRGTGDSESATPSVSDRSSSTQDDTQKSSADSASKSNVTLDFWYMGDSATQLQPIVDAFTAETGIKINVQAIPWNNLTEKLLTAIASRSGPDCMQTAVSRTTELVKSDAIMDLSKEIGEVEEFNKDKYFQVAYDSLKIGDAYYGVPWISDVYPLFYRTDLFSDAGYTEFPKDWDDLYTACKKIHEQTGNYTFDVSVAPNDYNFLMNFPFQAGSEVIDAQKREPLFNQPEMKEAMNYIMSFVNDGLSSDTDDGVERQIKLGNGDIAVCGGGSWLIPLVEQIPELEGKWGMAVWPAGPGGDSSVYAGSNLVIPTWTKDKDSALKWMEYLVKNENLLKHYETAAALPPKMAAWDTIIADSKYDMSVFKDQLEVGKTFPMVPEMQEIGIEFTKAMERIMVGKEDVDTVMQDMNTRTEEILARGQ